MTSQREVKRRYLNLMQRVAKDDYYKIDLTNRTNCYVCESCGHTTKTKDIDAGCTPMMFDCERCKGTARSMFYKDFAPDKEPTFEWYRPTLKEIMKYRRRPDMLDHIFNGGLCYRKISQEAILKEIEDAFFKTTTKTTI